MIAHEQTIGHQVMNLKNKIYYNIKWHYCPACGFQGK